ncbi:MAG: Flp pilus assembly complex ATPase component, partial [Actinomycetia bacterium]|nr:Flp pilus assembly complex ATPase component [Actinomycetes bacterium]
GLAEFLAAAVRRPDPANILIAGGTNAGKTTLLRALVDAIATSTPDDRLITVEDNLELMLHAHPKLGDVVEMEAREANVEGQGAFTMQDCVRNALHMSPDRLIVGECRGPEVIDMLNAMSSGNDGSLGTIHAESATGAIERVVAYGWQAQMEESATLSFLRGSVHLIVHIKRLATGERVVTQVIEITGTKTDDGGVQTLQLWAPDEQGRAVRTGVQPSQRLAIRLAAAGFETGGTW